MDIYCCSYSNSQAFGLSEIGNIANIIIAGFTLFLGYYVFIYQKNKDRQDTIDSEARHEKSIRLQWFKELIIQPKIMEIYGFYNFLRELRKNINSDNLSESQKIELINSIKEKQSTFRKSFIDSLKIITPELYNTAMINIDNLTDSLTNSISNDELKLSNSKTFDREIGDKIQYSFNDLFSLIFNYKG